MAGVAVRREEGLVVHPARDAFLCDAARSVSFCSFVPVKLVHVGPRGRSARMTS